MARILLLALASASAPVFVGAVPQETTGCFAYDAAYHPASLKGFTEPAMNVQTKLNCQQLCQETAGCEKFGFFEPSKACYLSGSGEEEMVESANAISGPAACPTLPSICTDVAPQGFPGKTASESQSMWLGGFVPTTLQCWPRNQYNQPAYCTKEPLTILDDKESTGSCGGLAIVMLKSGETCENNCAANTMCSSWQERIVDNYVTCWQGVGHECFTGAAGSSKKPENAGRFMHGHYNKLMDLTGVRVTNLVNMFSAHTTNLLGEAQAIKACKNTCLSVLPCQVWLYSKTEGCLIERPDVKSIEYPPTVESFRTGTPAAEAVIAGEYIMRLCGDSGDLQQPAVPLGYVAPEATDEGADGDEASLGAAPMDKEQGAGSDYVIPNGDDSNYNHQMCSSSLHPNCAKIPGQMCCPNAQGAYLPCCSDYSETEGGASDGEVVTDGQTKGGDVIVAPVVPVIAAKEVEEEEEPTTTTEETTTTTEEETTTTTTIVNPGRFITAGKFVYWENGAGTMKHMIPPSYDCSECGCGPSNIVQVSETEIDGINAGDPFTCTMLHQPEEAPPIYNHIGRFISAGKQVYWQSPFNTHLHLVDPNLNCDQCDCRNKIVAVSPAEIDHLYRGEDFDCGIFQRAKDAAEAAGPAGVHFNPNVPASAANDVAPTTTTTTTTEAVEEAATGGMPFWGWILIVLAALICLPALGFAIYIFFVVPPEKRKRARDLESIDPLFEDCPCAGGTVDSEYETDGDGDDEGQAVTDEDYLIGPGDRDSDVEMQRR